MKIHVVARPEAGYAREDPAGVGVVGAYVDAEVAEKVKTLSGVGAKVQAVTLNHVPPGFLHSAAAFGMRLEQTSEASALPADWPELVRKMWACVRKHDNTIPDEALDLMKDTLLGLEPVRPQG